MYRLVRRYTAVEKSIIHNRNDNDAATNADQPRQQAGT